MKNRLLQISILFLLFTFQVACVTSHPEEDSSTNFTPTASQNDKAALVNVNLGMAYLKQGNVERAKLKLRRALEQAPKSSEALSAMAYFLEMTGDKSQAETYYLRAIDIDSKRGAAQNNYGTFLCRQKRFREAEKRFLNAVADTNYLTPAEAYENIGLCLLQIPDLASAKHYFELAVQKDPYRAPSLLELAKLSYQQNEISMAKNYLARYRTAAGTSTTEVKALTAQLDRVS